MVTILGGKTIAPLFSSPLPTFWPVLPHITAETQKDLGPTDENQKSQWYYCSSATGLGFGKKNVVLGKNRGAPPKTLKNGPNGTKTALFPAFLVGHPGFWDELPFFSTKP